MELKGSLPQPDVAADPTEDMEMTSEEWKKVAWRFAVPAWAYSELLTHIAPRVCRAGWTVQ